MTTKKTTTKKITKKKETNIKSFSDMSVEKKNALINIAFPTVKNDKELILQTLIKAEAQGYTPKDFLSGNVYVLPFKGKEKNVGLVASREYLLKRAHSAGLTGIDAPVFEGTVKEGNLSCTVTCHKKDGHFAATVDYAEYYDSKKPLWNTKPKTMLAKVAESQALRKMLPEENLPYIPEEM